MRSSVLDIGSNTMRVVVFDISGESVKTIFGKGMKSVIFENTQNGKLTEIGMAALSKAISDMCAMTEQFGCDYHAFATSAFRDLSNQQEVIDFIYKQNGIKIRVLSGEEEAECDYLGMRRETGAVRGLGVDLGGGSCQVITFDESGMTAAASLKLGTVRLKNTFVAGNIPTEGEIKKISDCVKAELSKIENLGGEKRAMFAMGGSARAMLTIKHVLNANKQTDRVSPDDLTNMIEFAKTPGAETFLKGVVRKRYDTVVIGMVVMRAIAEYDGADYIKVLDCGAREGFVKKFIM